MGRPKIGLIAKVSHGAGEGGWVWGLTRLEVAAPCEEGGGGVELSEETTQGRYELQRNLTNPFNHFSPPVSQHSAVLHAH